MHLFDLSPHIIAFLCEFSKIFKRKKFCRDNISSHVKFRRRDFRQYICPNLVTTKFFVVNVVICESEANTQIDTETMESWHSFTALKAFVIGTSKDPYKCIASQLCITQ